MSSNITLSRACEPTLCAVFPHRVSNLNITFNARQILENSIRVKSQKCTKLAGHVPLWLALFNDYWLPSNDTNMLAFASAVQAKTSSRQGEIHETPEMSRMLALLLVPSLE